ncbi:S-layer homology domain-containing protein [Paenibacillus alba]|uniref:S-layer homology domain-containing protein n=1 Tax=Paenibacillus alba TaxID=1197127 RepID=A0ABU6G4R8_9BACL|nr:DUF4350 domain-containing protein [Paenibacillus alba]MEC0228267.1 S-layer homology domain-containing protein [Paenibacillus alba]
MFQYISKHKKWYSLIMTLVMLVTMAIPLQPIGAEAVSTTLVKWDFANSTTTATEGISENLSKQVSVVGTGTLGYVVAAPDKAASALNWSANSSYWEAPFVTTGYTGIQLSSKQGSSGTGPKDFKVQYSLDHSSWTDVPNGVVTTANDFKSGVLSNLSLPSEVDNQSIVYVRWVVNSGVSVNGGAIASGGSSKIDDIVITGTSKNPSNTPQTTAPVAAKLSFPTLTNVKGTAGAVGSSVQVAVYFDDNALAGATTAAVDGSFDLTITNAQSKASVFITATENGKDPSNKVQVNLTVAPKTALPVASKITFPNVLTINGAAGAVAANSFVTINLADNSLAGSGTAGADGSFAISLTNPNSNSVVYVTAQEQGKTSSDKVAITLATLADSYKAGDIVFSQFYVNGGNSGAFYKTKFLELYNTTDQDINLNGWSVAYTAAGTMAFAAGKPLSGIIKAHGYYLIAGNTGATGAALPVKPDIDLGSGINPSASTGGAFVLAKKTDAVTGAADTDVIDLLAFTNASTTTFKNPLYWGQPFVATNLGSGTILRKTMEGSDPRGAVGSNNGWFTKDPSKDFVVNAPSSTSNPAEIIIRNSSYMISPAASKITLSTSGNTSQAVGTAGAVPGASTVKAYLENSGVVTSAAQATAAADGSFTLSYTNSTNNPTVYLTHTDTQESKYTQIQVAGSNTQTSTIANLRKNDTNGFPLSLGYTATIEGVITSTNGALGSELTSFYVQDATGGMNIISPISPTYEVKVGKKLRLTGHVVMTSGTTQFVPSTVTELGDDTAPVPASIPLTALSSYATAEQLEGKLVSFKAKVTNIPASGPDYNVTVTDESDNTAIVSLLSTTGIDVAGGAVTLGETYTFTGIVKQAKITSPYTSGYMVMPRAASDILGELQIAHTPLTKAYIGVDTSFKASVKFADRVTVWYKGQLDAAYTPVVLASADKLNYNGKIAAGSMPTGKLLYYMEAVNQSTTKSVGSSSAPITVDIVEDTDGPEYTDLLPLEGDELETKHPAISATLDDANGVDPASIRIYIDDLAHEFTSKAVITETRIKLVLTTADDLSAGEHTIILKGQDKLGNASTKSWKFKIAERFVGGNHYYGTTHNHTNISHDADGSPESALLAAKAHHYDFFAFSDHSHDIDSSLVGSDNVDHNGMPERTGGSNWALTKSLAKDYTKDGSFVVFPAFEMTSTTWGHSNVFGTSNFIDRVESGGKYQNLQSYYAWVLTYDNIVAQFNHPAMSANAFDNFIPYDKNVDRLFTMLEVGNGSGKYSYANAQDKFFSALDLGWHVAPTYGEDNHDATWGETKQRTVIVANDLTQDSLMDAMRKKRVYFTEDPNAKLEVSASGWYMGSTTDSKTLEFKIVGSDPVLEQKSDPAYSYLKTVSNDNIAKVELITNGGRVIDTYVPTTDSTSFTWSPTVNVIGGQQWFVTRVTQKDGDRVYSSPIWSPVEPIAVKVSNVSAVEGAVVGGYDAPLKAGISNMGTVDVTNLTAHFYYDQVDAAHLIGDAQVASLKTNSSTTASVVWSKPPAGDHRVIVVMNSTDQDLGDNKFEQVFTVKPPLGKTILIDASKNNENTTKDTGTYKDNLKLFTTMMRQQGYTVAENTAAITDDTLKSAAVLYISHPSSSYGSAEIAAITKFVAQGGSLYLAEKSNYGGSNQNLNAILAGAGSSLMVNNDGVFDETADGNFWGTPLTSNFSVRAHPKPVSNNLTDFVPTIEYYSGSSVAKNDGKGNKVALTDTDALTILVRGNESTFQDAAQIKADSVAYNPRTPNGKAGPALTDVTGGSAIPLVASEIVGKGRIIVSGMNIFNDKQMDQTFNAKGNDPFALNVMNWLSHLEPKVTPIGDARNLAEGTDVLVQGKVTTAAGNFFDSAYVQDETGGIMAFNEVPVGTLQLGDVVRVYGHIKIFENNTELEFDKFDNSIVKVSSGTPLVPKGVSTKDSISDAYQGQLVKVTGNVVARPDATTYVVNDGSGEVMVFVDGYIINQSGPIPQLQVGEILEAVGLSGKYSQGDRIRVRDTKELKKVTSMPVKVTGVTLDKAAVSLIVGAQETLTAAVAPTDAANKAVKWSTSDSKVATVVDGVVTAVSAGTATITVQTEDGSFEASTVVTVSSKNDGSGSGGSGGSGSGGSGSNSNTSSPSTPTTTPEQPGKVVISAEQLKSQESGKTTITVKSDTTEVKLPSHASELLGSGNLVIKSDKLAVEVPASILKQLESKLTSEDLKDSAISLKLSPINSAEAKTIIAQSERMSSATIKLAGEVYEFSLSITSANGKVEQLAKFDQPIVIRLKVDASMNEKLAGIFYISDFGELTYIGGEYKNGEITASISHFSKYAVLEVKKTFKDVPASHWAFNVISELTAKQILSGTGESAFEPSRSITRAEFTTMLQNVMKWSDASTQAVFSDVPATAWYAKAVASANQAGIVTGKSATQFDPNGLITREEMITMTMRAYEKFGGTKAQVQKDTRFDDMNLVSSWAQEHVQKAAKLGLIQGRAQGQFDPSGMTSRAEAAQIIYNLLGNK